MYTFYHFYSTSCNSLPNWVYLFLISTVVCFISRTYCTLLRWCWFYLWQLHSVREDSQHRTASKTPLEAVCTYLPRRILLESALRYLLWRDLIQANAQRSGCLQVNVKKETLQSLASWNMQHLIAVHCVAGTLIVFSSAGVNKAFKRTVHPKMKIVIICSPSCHSNTLSLFSSSEFTWRYF